MFTHFSCCGHTLWLHVISCLTAGLKHDQTFKYDVYNWIKLALGSFNPNTALCVIFILFIPALCLLWPEAHTAAGTVNGFSLGVTVNPAGGEPTVHIMTCDWGAVRDPPWCPLQFLKHWFQSAAYFYKQAEFTEQPWLIWSGHITQSVDDKCVIRSQVHIRYRRLSAE